ncbi:D-tyrosyl-tRNA(Tyr) deacylase [Hydrogenovibrio sp. SC-1]|uniref:D-aminoacyl-tRNA deacylase n=1 Tax=Hydrogenovibrio sp. SC-1 TaxID=2065820 RepID=UPI000C7C4B04|nr:D-aminoacyl-tRNA deacylase [Hydrogenovibrio sp. SC-1]PLA74609.1 D-tyrosyl-tRNA(Tyr) deacylase [Hydrogenovibrio sp. SC-1]
MICLLQRVTQGQVEVQNQQVASIGTGLVVLCGFQPHDNEQTLSKMAHKLLHFRVFADDADKMNFNIQQACQGQGAELLLVPQFTLSASTQKGLRPSFHTAAAPELANSLFQQFIKQVEQIYRSPQVGEFGANMQVTLTNDGPVTFWLET